MRRTSYFVTFNSPTGMGTWRRNSTMWAAGYAKQNGALQDAEKKGWFGKEQWAVEIYQRPRR